MVDIVGVLKYVLYHVALTIEHDANRTPENVQFND